MVTYILCERRYCLFDDSEHKEHQNRLLINNCYQITYSLKINRQIYSAPPSLCNIKCALHKKSTTPYPNTRNSFSCALSCRENFLLNRLYRRTFVCILRAFYGLILISASRHSVLHHHYTPKSSEEHHQTPLSKTCFSPEIMPFSCPENTPQKCKWLQCVRLVINKRRPSAAVAAAPQRHPRASPSAETPKGAPSAELQATPSRGRRPSAHTHTNKSPLNRSNFIA